MESNTQSISSARANLYRLVDQVLETGEPVIIHRHGQTVQLAATPTADKLSRVTVIPDLVTGDENDLPDVHWDEQWKPFI